MANLTREFFVVHPPRLDLERFVSWIRDQCGKVLVREETRERQNDYEFY